MKTRNEIPELIKENGIGVEVGCGIGGFSKVILERSKLKKLYSIDAFKYFPKDEYFDVANVGNIRMAIRHLRCKKKLSKFGNRSEIIKGESKEVVKKFKNNSLDFVYIDANHSYLSTLQDINLWFPKLKEGGIIAGHDYTNRFIGNIKIFVKSAVNEFILNNNLGLGLTEEELPSWWCIK